MYELKPQVPVDRLRDDMANNRAGYSFVHDPRNELEDAYLDLSKRACLSPLDGLISRERWSIPHVNRYLAREREFVQHLMLLLYLLGG